MPGDDSKRTAIATLAAAIDETEVVPLSEDAAQESTEPLIPMELVISRLQSYLDAGVDAETAVELALDDAIETCDFAAEQEHTGAVGALINPDST